MRPPASGETVAWYTCDEGQRYVTWDQVNQLIALDVASERAKVEFALVTYPMKFLYEVRDKIFAVIIEDGWKQERGELFSLEDREQIWWDAWYEPIRRWKELMDWWADQIRGEPQQFALREECWWRDWQDSFKFSDVDEAIQELMSETLVPKRKRDGVTLTAEGCFIGAM